MRVCILVANNCTVDSRVLRQAETFSRAGHETVIVAVHRGDVSAVEDRDGFQIRRVPSRYTWREGYPRLIGIPARILLGRKPLAISTSSKAVRPAVETPIAARRSLRARARVAVRRTIRPVRRFANAKILYPRRFRIIDRRMAREAIAFRADLYWANDIATIRAVREAVRVTGARSVYDAHEVMWDAPTVSRRQRTMWGRVEERHIRRFSRLYTVCEPISRVMAERYQVQPPTVVLNCPRIDATSMAPEPAASPINVYRRPGEHLIVFHGTLSIHRGLEQLVEAICILGVGYRLVVLGHGPFLPELEVLVANSGAADHVSFHRSVSPAELPAWIAGADLGTIPYQRFGLNHEYSTPNKLFEYMHLGIPIIVNDLPEIRRIVEDAGNFGVIVDCSDPVAMAEAIKDLCADPSRRAAMRTAARLAAPRYCWENQEQLILSSLEPV